MGYLTAAMEIAGSAAPSSALGVGALLVAVCGWRQVIIRGTRVLPPDHSLVGLNPLG